MARLFKQTLDPEGPPRRRPAEGRGRFTKRVTYTKVQPLRSFYSLIGERRPAQPELAGDARRLPVDEVAEQRLVGLALQAVPA